MLPPRKLRRRTRGRSALMLAVVILCSAALCADDVADEPLATSPAIVALQRKLQAGDQKALAEFWLDTARHTTPIVETTAGDSRYVIVTFVWRGDAATQGVVLQAQLGRTRDPNENRLAHLAGSD